MSAPAVSRRRLCIVNPFQHGGGAEYQIGCLLDLLVTMDLFDVFYLARHTDPRVATDRYQLVKIGSDSHVPRFGYIADALPLYRSLATIRPDTIYQRVAGGYTGICAYYAARNRCRMIWHVAHDSDVSRDSSFHGRNPVRRFLEKSSIEYAIRRADGIVTQTESQSRSLRVNYGRSADMVIPNFHPAAAERLDKSGPLTVVWIANLKPIKRPDAFVRLAAALSDMQGVRFQMVGSPADSEDPEWSQSLMQSIAATPNLEYLGRLPQADVNSLLATSHVFVNTSVQEGFPNTFIQSWMREVPVVSLSVNPDDVLGRERVGAFAGSETGLHRAVRELLANPPLLATQAARAREYAMARHSLQNGRLLATFLLSCDAVLSEPLAHAG